MIANPKPSIFRYLLLVFILSYFIVFWSLFQVLFYNTSIMFTYITLGGSFLVGLLDYRSISKRSPSNIHAMIGLHLVALCVLSIVLAWTCNRPSIPLFKNTAPPEIDATSFLLETLEMTLFFIFLNALAFILIFLVFQGRFVDIGGPGRSITRLLLLFFLTAFCSLVFFIIANLDLASIFLLGTGSLAVILVLIGLDLQQASISTAAPRSSDIHLPSTSISYSPRGLLAVLDASACIAVTLILPTLLNGNIIDVASMGLTFLLAMPFLAVALFLLERHGGIKIAGIMSIANGLLVICLGFGHAWNHELTLVLSGFILGNSIARLFLLPSRLDGERKEARNASPIISSLVCLVLIGGLLDANGSRFFAANLYIIPPAGIAIGVALCAIGCLLFIKWPGRGHEDGEGHDRDA